ILQRNGIERIDCVGKDFDPETCDAVMLSDADTENKVLFEIQPGYRMNGMVIRHAKVAVSKLKDDDSKEAKENQEEKKEG
ncbi:MAG TPA: nucleotide exchange factor GrpE, partial [Candidatus Micrarchaeota archaeon]|nr:nucleotide exchange factor GrpE [Candidatus Micrarchaeota archaeon]